MTRTAAMSIALLLLAQAGASHAQIQIRGRSAPVVEDSAASTPEDDRRRRMMQRLAEMPPPAPASIHIPTRQDVLDAIAASRAAVAASPVHAGLLDHPTPESPSRSSILALGCELAGETPSGVQTKAGPMNGVQSIYLCPDLYLIVQELDYNQPLTQRITLFDDEYAADPVRHLRRITQHDKRDETRRRTRWRWINHFYEIQYILHTDTANGDAAALTAALRASMEHAIDQALARVPTG